MSAGIQSIRKATKVRTMKTKKIICKNNKTNYIWNFYSVISYIFMFFISVKYTIFIKFVMSHEFYDGDIIRIRF